MKKTTYGKNNTERTSVSGLKAIVTVEAALAIPVFMFAVLSLISIIEIQSIRIKVHHAASNAGQAAAEYMIDTEHFSIGKLKSDIVKNIGFQRINNSYIRGGVLGLYCGESTYSEVDGEINVVVKYDVKLPFPDFTGLHKSFKEELKVRAWSGYYNVLNNPDEDEVVYVTKNGSVYHTNHNCTYLKPAIHYIPYESLETIRNSSGRRYKRCEMCGRKSGVSGVYVTDYGDSYHNSLKCGALKRTVYAVKKSEVEGKGECSKCSQ